MSSLNIRFGKIYVIMQPFIPTKTIQKMKNLGVSESEVLDVFSHGEFGETTGGVLYASKNTLVMKLGFFTPAIREQENT